MDSSEANFDVSAAPEGSQELNGKDASYRNAPMVSEPSLVIKKRIRGALVPMSRRKT